MNNSDSNEWESYDEESFDSSSAASGESSTAARFSEQSFNLQHSSENPSATQQTLNTSGDNPDLMKTCWVCFGTEEDNTSAQWIKPCRCKGTTKWVHHSCLMRWIDEKQKGQVYNKVACPQCNTEYIIIFPSYGRFCGMLQTIDRMVYKSSPVIATGVLLTSVYWTAVTYGAITVMQVLGHKEGLDMMEKADPLFLLIGLPAIPVGLCLGKMIQWDEYLLRLWRRHAHKISLLNYIFPDEDDEAIRRPPLPEVPAREIKFTRVFCGAMLLPTIATIFGKFVFRTVEGNLQRSILGGIGFSVLKGVLKLYLKQQIYLRAGRRKVVDFDESHSNTADNGSQT